MRLNNDGEHDLGQFESFSTSQEDLDTPIRPESIEGDSDISELEKSTEWKRYITKKISSKVKIALYSVGVTIALFVLIDLVISIYQVWQVHWSLGTLLTIACALMIGFSIRAIYHWVKDKDGLEVVHELQARAEELRKSASGFETEALLCQITQYYEKTPLEAECRDIVASLPDYLNDKERLDTFEAQFLSPLDRKVEKLIQRYSLQTAGAIGFSPFPSLDAFFTLWRGSMMINEIALTYGVKPTLANRFKVLARVARTVAFAGLSQSGLDALDVSNLPYVSIGTKVIQGFGAGIAMARVGHYCAIACRPIPIKDDGRIFGKFLSALKLLIGKKVFGLTLHQEEKT